MMETTRIFVTHNHGDHIYGLPSLLLQVGTFAMGEGLDLHPINIYGPPGLHHYLCTALRIAEAAMSRQVIVHEMMLSSADMDRMPEASWYWKRHWQVYNHDSINKNGRNDFPNVKRVPLFSGANGLWDLTDDSEGVRVEAGLILHRIPCWGFVMTESDISGKLLPSRCDELGVRNEDRVRIKSGMEVKGKNGLVVKTADVCGPPVRGRKITILGDTSDPSLLTEAAANSDVLVHECTFDNTKTGSARRNGHSTPSMAINVAHDFRAKRIVLNHIGTQYVPINWTSDTSEMNGMQTDMDLLQQAKEGMGLRRNHIWVARDFETLRVPVGGFTMDVSETISSPTLSRERPDLNPSRSMVDKKASKRISPP